MEQHDVIIVGSGPGGAGCAKALRNQGVDVLVLERDALPRYKCCSAVLFGQTQVLLRKYFGKDAPGSVYCSNDKYINAEDVREWDPVNGYKPYIWEIPKDGEVFPSVFQNVWRNTFDKWLLDESGAPWRDNTRVTGFAVDGDHVTVQAGDTAYRCRYLIGADGGASAVRRILRPTGSEPAGASVSILQTYFKLESLGKMKPGSWTVIFDKEIGEMLNCIHQKDDYLLLCVGGFRGRNLRDSIEKLKALLAEKFDVRLGERWRDEGCQLALAPPFLGQGRVLLTGEAAGHIYLNGEGISAAIDSGWRCGMAVAEGLKTGQDPLPIYENNSRDIAAHIQKCLAQIHFLAV